ncbi:substrate-binding domain-containing protein [Streptomyces sp.]|uniref:vWA domain-containing protein n=1 Tax=Streptomyces sp. TaxID=1931 RepID=UPI0028116B7E|nr:substrate-binding domain-containing protein [Streptomyces sp.]
MLPLDPRGTANRALLVGVSEYDLTKPPHGVPGDLPAVEHNLGRMREVLARGRVFEEQEIRVLASPTLDAFGRALQAAAEEAEGLLLLYFAGHGAIPNAGDELFLQMRNARVIPGGSAVFPGAEMFSSLLAELATSPARRIVVILDCCFAGNAAWIWEPFYAKRRVLLLMSVQANHRIDAGDPRTPTPFTDVLAALLEEEGETGLRDLSDRLRQRMATLGHLTERGKPWEPQFRAEPDVDVLLTAKEASPGTGPDGDRPPQEDTERPAPLLPGPDPGSGLDPGSDPGPGSEPGLGQPGVHLPGSGEPGLPAPGSGEPGAPGSVTGEPDLPASGSGQSDPSVPGPGQSDPSAPCSGGSGLSAPGSGEPDRPASGPGQPGASVSGSGQSDPSVPGPGGSSSQGRREVPGSRSSPFRLVRLLVARFGRSRRRGPLRPDAGRPRRRTAVRVVAPVVLAAGLLGLGVLGLIKIFCGNDSVCDPALELRVLTDPDLEPTVRAAADAYLTSDGNITDAGCRRTGITVYSAGSSDVVAALRGRTGAWQEPRDADTNPQRDIGPQPDVWIPASRAAVDRVEAGQDTDAVAGLEADEEPLAYSPVVLAVPHDIGSEALGDRADHPLNDMIDTLTERYENAAVRRPDPEFTTAGLLATVGLYGTDARAVARGERLVAQPGPPSPTAAELLCTLPDDDAVDDRTAALVPEFLLRSGVGCDRTTRSPRFAQYPEDVPGVEPVFVRVRWAGADRDESARDASAEGFRDWLAGEHGREVFARDGFRSAYDRELLDKGPAAEGVLRAPSPLHQSAGRDAMERALKAYQDAGGPGRVLFLLDSSGSMTGLWKGPSGGPGLLRQSLGGLGGQDEYGVWAVAGPGDRPYGTLLPLDRHRRADAERAVGTARVRDAEADPHAALLAALDEMTARGDDHRPQLIVHITDGEDNDRLTGDRLDEVLARARTSDVPVTVVSLQSGGCDPDRPDRRIADVSGGRCLDAVDDLGAALHDEVARTGTGEG